MQLVDLNTKNGSAYGLDIAAVSLNRGAAEMMSCRLPPAEQSHGHTHREAEIFYFVSGPAEVTNGSSTIRCPAGSAILFEPFEPHIITNLDDEKALDFLSVYWPQSTSSEAECGVKEDRPTLIYSTPPTPNGDLHLGHLSGPYLAADILARSLRRNRTNVWQASGRDDHQSYVLYKAECEGSDAQSVADEFADKILETWAKAGIELDGFITPDREGAYAHFVREGINRLMARGLIYEKEAPALFDSNGRYLHEAFVQGICPHCGAGSDGNACEACARPNDCSDLGTPSERLSQLRPSVAPVKRLYFKMSALQSELEQYVRMADMPAKVCNLCAQMLQDGLPDICISHPGDWGIRHDTKGHEGSIVYVWFEMAFGYLWQASELNNVQEGDRWKRAAKVYGGDFDIVHAYGFDNAYYHTLLFPAVYFGLDLALQPPKTHVVNELLNLNGSKFSTSRGHLIWARDYLSKLPRDYVRFGLAYHRPEGIGSDFVPVDVEALLERTFSKDLAGWIDTVVKAIGETATVPETGVWTNGHRAFFESLEFEASRADRALSFDAYSPRRAAHHLRRLIALGADFARSEALILNGSNPRNNNHRRTSIALLVHGLRLFARSAGPITPDLVHGLQQFMSVGADDLADTFFPGGHVLKPGFAPHLLSASAQAEVDNPTSVNRDEVFA